MKPSRVPSWILAPLLVACALAVRLAFNPVLGHNAPYVTFVLSAVFAALWGGLGPGVAALILGAAAANFFVLSPVYTPGFGPTSSPIILLGYVLVTGAVIAVVEQRRRQRARLAGEATRREKVEETERALRHRFEITLASIGDGVISTDAQSRVTFINEVASELTGWPAAEARGQLLADIFNTSPEGTGTVLISKSGARRPIDQTTAPLRDGSEDRPGSVLVFRDISGILERDAAVQRAGRESEYQFRALADSIPQLAWMAHPDGHIFWYNRRWYEYTGATPEDMEGWGWQSVNDPAALPGVLIDWQHSLATGQFFDRVITLRGADGVLRPFLTRVAPVRGEDGSVVRWFGTNTDITERQKNEDRLRASDERFRRLYEADVVGIICADDCKVFEANDVFLKMLGYTRHDLLAGAIQWDALSPVRYDFQDSGIFGKPHEKELLHSDGHGVPVLMGATWLQQDPPQYLGVILDLTERKQLERRVLEAQKLDSVGLLAGGVAHDFNNMLVGVIGSASLAMDLVPRNGEAAELLDQIVRTGEQLAHLTRQMLAYAGKGRFFIEPLDMSEMAAEMAGLVGALIPKKIRMQTDWAADLPPIEADRGQMHQVFTNLVMNASEAIADQAGVISISTGVRDLSESAIRSELEGVPLEPGRYVYLQVCDNGCGMDQNTKTRIFDPFFSTKFTGRGLGLAAVGGIVRSHKGAIGVESSPGTGTRFTVFLPASAGAASQSAIPLANEYLRGTGTILVVDDESVVREMARMALERYGYKVLLAESGSEAVNFFKRHPGVIEAVVLDLSMPAMGGDEAFPRMHSVRPDAKFVISSGHSEVETRALFRGKKIAGYLQKPYTATVLAEAVAKALQN
ncbi:MAG: PAS domain S-box protein [Terriglobia bacterium]